MSSRRIIVMGMVLLVGMLYALRFESAPTSDQAKDQPKPVFRGLAAESISAIAVSEPKGDYRLEKNNAGTWLLTSPPDTGVEKEVVEKLTETLAALQTQGSLPAAELQRNMADYAFEKPQLAFRISSKQGEHSLLFGKRHPFLPLHYAQTDNKAEVLLIGALDFQALNKSKADVREHAIFHFSADQIEELKITLPEDKETKLRRAADGKWFFSDEEGEFEADPNVARDTAADIAQIQAKSFVDDPNAKLNTFGLEPPAVKVSLKLKGKTERIEFRAGEYDQPKDGEQKVLKRAFSLKLETEPTIYEVGRRFYSDLIQGSVHFRDKTPFDSITPQSITSLTVRQQIATGYQEFLLERSGEGQASSWSIVSRNSGENQLRSPADKEKVESWTKRVLAFQLLSYLEPGETGSADYGLSSPFAEIEINTAEGRKKLVFGNLIRPKKSDVGEAAPRYGAVRPGDYFFPVVISAADWTDLCQPSSYFAATNTP